MDGKWSRLAKVLVNYSTRVQPVEIALVHCIDEVNQEFVSHLIDEIFKAGGQALIWQDSKVFMRQLIMNDNERGLTLMLNNRLAEIQKVQVVFHLFSEDNASEFSDIPDDRRKFYLN